MQAPFFFTLLRDVSRAVDLGARVDFEPVDLFGDLGCGRLLRGRLVCCVDYACSVSQLVVARRYKAVIYLVCCHWQFFLYALWFTAG